jgi:peptidoglycan hydrolase-like protein with peptidoglycan-binding domain
MTKTKPSAKKQKKKKIIVTTLAVGATGILGYFGWQYLKKKKKAKKEDIDSLIKNIDKPIVLSNDITIVKPKAKTTTTVYKQTVSQLNDDFPLKKGSKGETVRKLQEALITKYGKQTLPNYGADGDFGSETTNALIKLGLPTTINESTFNVIVQGIPQINPSTVGKDLYNAAVSKDFNKTLAALKNLKSVEDYSSANEQFKQNRLNGVHQTIVNGLLSTFTSDSQKQKIKFEFLRMGLKFDGSKWSLSGIDGTPIITVTPTTVWVNATESVKVPARMVLGNEVSKRLDYTLFENKGKYFLVQTKNIKYL